MGGQQAASKRYLRAMQRLRDNPDSFKWYHLKDVEFYVKARFKEMQKGKTRYGAKRLLDNLAKAKEFMMTKKVKSKVAKKQRAGKETANTLSDKTKLVVAKLLQGELVEGFTLMPTEKVAANHTVTPVVDLKDGNTLCKYK